jgi:hypothetical protein
MAVAPDVDPASNQNLPSTVQPALTSNEFHGVFCSVLCGTISALMLVSGVIIACCFIQLNSRNFVLDTSLVCARRMLPDEWRTISDCSRLDEAVMLYLGEGESSVSPMSKAVCGQLCWRQIGPITISACSNVTRGLALWVKKDASVSSGSCEASPDPNKMLVLGCCFVAIGACGTVSCVLLWLATKKAIRKRQAAAHPTQEFRSSV